MKLFEDCDLLEEEVYDNCSECYRLDICLTALHNERCKVENCDLISRQVAIDVLERSKDKTAKGTIGGFYNAIIQHDIDKIKDLPSAESERYAKIPDSGIEDLSDGYHTFRQLYYQRMILFATIVKQNKDRAWKSLRHEDGELCFDGEWFIVGIDTPEGSYTYHYEVKYFSMFDCKELERGKHWDGHTEKDVVRLLSLPSAEPKKDVIELGTEYRTKDYTITITTNSSEREVDESHSTILEREQTFKVEKK